MSGSNPSLPAVSKRDERLGLFEGIGVEIEYAIVERDQLNVRPIAAQLLRDRQQHVQRTALHGSMGWSNELAAHVLEIKNLTPTRKLTPLIERFQDEVVTAGHRLEKLDAQLLPTAMHPWMDPRTESSLWDHEDALIYRTFDRIFDCRHHGWMNLQSVHINLPFANDEEFRRLHAAIRTVLPLLPGIDASSPILEGRVTGFADSRLHHYLSHSGRIPESLGLVIPETLRNEAEYQRQVYAPLERAAAALDPEGVLEAVWLNARGAIARFDRGSIEIRLLDSQECPLADLAIVALVAAVVRALCEERWCDIADLERLPTPHLRQQLEQAIESADDATVGDHTLLECLGWPYGDRPTLAELWRHLARSVESDPWIDARLANAIESTLARGTLASAIVEATGQDPDRATLLRVYDHLATCLAEGIRFNADDCA